MFACLVGEGYTNKSSSPDLFCIFNHNEDACRYGIGIGVLAFLACIFFFMVDVYFPQISNATDRKYLVLADLGFSGTGAPGQGRASCNGRPRPMTWPPLGAWQRELLPLARRLQATRCQPEVLWGAGGSGVRAPVPGRAPPLPSSPPQRQPGAGCEQDPAVLRCLRLGIHGDPRDAAPAAHARFLPQASGRSSGLLASAF